MAENPGRSNDDCEVKCMRRLPVDLVVRFGSKADMCNAQADVRFTPESGHVQCTIACPLSANSGH